jgi:hypothetical protein
MMNAGSRRLAVPLLLAACAVEPGAPVEPGLVDDATGEPGAVSSVSSAVLAPDPAAAVAGGWCNNNVVWNGTTARVYYPSSGGCDSSVFSPLVVVMRGAGFSHLDYHYLLRHLARNGYIGVSIDAVPESLTVAGYQAAADKAWAFVTDFMWTAWSKRFFIDPSRVALIGHSRGGEAVKFLADDLAGDPLFQVRSVIALAPTNQHHVALTGNSTVSAMVLVGGSDADTTTDRAYSTHDEASSDGSQSDPAVNPAVLYRAMKLLSGGSHAGFATEAAQSSVTQGYVLAFLHAHLRNDVTYYEDYVRGDAVPAAWPLPVTTQYSDGFLRRVIDNFDDGTLANPTIGGSIGQSLGSGGVIDLDPSPDTPHHTHALRYTPPANGSGFVWGIPPGKTDVTLFKYLSLRVGQLAGVPTDDLRVRIVNSGVSSPSIRLTDHGVLAQPVAMCLAPVPAFPGACASIATQAHMGTIRVPLDAFGPHDNVTTVHLTAASEAIDGEFLIDNLELSEFILKP